LSDLVVHYIGSILKRFGGRLASYESGNLFGKYIFDAKPESERQARQPIAADGSTGGQSARFETVVTPAEMRWKVLHSLPKRHQGYVFEAVSERLRRISPYTNLSHNQLRRLRGAGREP
jgi:hypothetical protein